eukprot:GHVR01162970.1.p1 GENE.GHVR01162970.1~~GHVR01162970.1.p1  ORF type:complete len:153 (-),score=17.72 GHVR01162970.1:179-637(-)
MKGADVEETVKNCPYWVLPLYAILKPLDFTKAETLWQAEAVKRLRALALQCSKAWDNGVAHNDLRFPNVVQDQRGEAHAIDWDFSIHGKQCDMNAAWERFVKCGLPDFVLCSHGGKETPEIGKECLFSTWVRETVIMLSKTKSFSEMHNILQ